MKKISVFIIVAFVLLQFTEFPAASAEERESTPVKIAIGNAPSISSYGGKIAYINSKKGQPELFVMDPLGGEKALTDDIFFETDPSFASENEIVYVSDASGNRELWLINIKTGERKMLTKSSGLKYSPNVNRYGEIVYVSGFYPELDLYILRNGVEERITFDKKEKFSPVWSLDGRRIAFIGRDGREYGIFTVDGNGNKEKIASNVYYRGLAWGKKDDSLLFVRRSSEGYDIWKIELNSRKESLIYGGITDSWEIEPAFGENKILFSSDKDGVYNLFEINLDNAAPKEINVPVAAPAIAPSTLPLPASSESLQDEQSKAGQEIKLENKNGISRDKTEENAFDYSKIVINDHSELPVPEKTGEKKKVYMLEILLALLLSSVSIIAAKKTILVKLHEKNSIF